MTANRRAELQRKLAMTPVPQPPAGLAERIKSDIPKELMVDADRERRRLRSAVAFNVRVAASIILLVSSVYLALNLVSRRFGPMEPAKLADNTASPVAIAETAPQQSQAPATPAKAKPMEAPAPARVAATPKLVAQARTEPLALRDAELKEADAKEESAGNAVAGRAPAAAMAPPPPAPPPALQMLSEQRARADSAVVLPSLDVEIAAAPFDATKHVVRVSLDNAREPRPRVVFDDDAVAAWRTLGDGLYEVLLRAGDANVIATVESGELKRVIRRGDLRTWEQASKRTKSAALDAALDAGVSPAQVEAKAREAGLDDLAKAAKAREKP